jgi:glycosyltransferase involved in cell wall biosynthesis
MPHPIRKILVIAPTPFFSDRGCHVHIAEQIWALQQKGLAIKVATYGLGRNIAGVATARTPRFPWYKKTGPGPSWHKFYLDIFLLLKAWGIARRWRPDVIHAHLHEGALIGWLIRRWYKLPLIFDCQGSLTGELLAHNFPLAKPRLARAAWHALEKWIDRQADHILAQSSNMFRELTQEFGVAEQKISMVYDGVNVTVFAPGKQDHALLKQLKISENDLVITFLGVLTPYQGVDDLLAAFPKILERVPQAVLLVMGYPNVKKYKALAEKLSISHAVRFTGRVPYEQAAQYLALGDIAVSPKRSQTEANGKIYNYMAAGLPTVAFDTVVNRDILGDLGMYVGIIGDRDGLAQAIVSLLKNKTKREQLAQSVRRQAVAKYSWAHVADRIVEAYAKALTPWQLQVFAVSIRKKEKWRWIKQHLQPWLRPTSRCLDVGSGVGTLSFLQEQLGGQWDFLETDRSASQETRSIVAGAVHSTDVEHSHFSPHTFDIITAFDVIEHLPNPRHFLQRATQLLKPGGVLILTTPAHGNKMFGWRWMAKTFFGIDKEAHGHVIDGFSRQQLEQLCQQTNLSPQHLESFSFFFTEMIELIYNSAYVIKNRLRQKTTGYNLALSPASKADLARHSKQLAVLRVLYPLLRGISLLDHIFPFRRGYEWGLVAVKRT